jgi:hypothetical protein
LPHAGGESTIVSWLQKSESLENCALLVRHFGPADKGLNISSAVASEVEDGVVFNVSLSMCDEKMAEFPCNTGQDTNKPSESGNWDLWKRSICSAAVFMAD